MSPKRQRSMLQVFVYGTLKPGERNFERYCAAAKPSSTLAVARGRLFALPMGYPAMTPASPAESAESGERWVQGYVLTFDAPVAQAMLATLDALEGYVPGRRHPENEYCRALVETYTPAGEPLGQAWVYLMEVNEAQRLGGVELLNGLWTSTRLRYGSRRRSGGGKARAPLP